jgi:ornithine cyclodeaminase/alanine dehydrogenase-like protein (mu-crystallin family)
VSLPFIDGAALRQLLPITAAIDALEAAFARGSFTTPPRTHLETGTGTLLLMPSFGEQGVGVKLVTVAPQNMALGLPLIHAVYVLFGQDSLAPAAVIDGAELTALRTSAVSALATRHLAPPEASRLVVFGAGVQARAHVESMQAVRPVEHVRVVSRTAARAEELVAEARRRGLEAAVADPGAVAQADLVCTCTTSDRPVFDGSLLRAGAHVNAVGAYRPDTRELDDRAVARARVVVERRDAALAEAGDLLIPMEAGTIEESHIVADLTEVVRGGRVRRDADDITVFKSVGVAFEDLAVAAAALARLPPA